MHMTGKDLFYKQKEIMQDILFSFYIRHLYRKFIYVWHLIIFYLSPNSDRTPRASKILNT